jgi:hypothetical protein
LARNEGFKCHLGFHGVFIGICISHLK